MSVLVRRFLHGCQQIASHSPLNISESETVKW